MEKKWKNPQAYIIVTIILLIFVYIGIDAFKTKPQIQKNLTEVQGQYVDLSNFLDKKIPQIDSTFKEQAKQINEQKIQMTELEQSLNTIVK